MLRIKKIKPKHTSLIVTGERYTEDMYDEHGLIEQGCKKGDLKQYQKVVAKGSMVRELEVGDTVMINFLHYAVLKHDPNSVKADMGMQQITGYQFNWITLDDENGNPQECLFIDDQDVLFAFEGEEIQGKKSTIILPEKKKVITN